MEASEEETIGHGERRAWGIVMLVPVLVKVVSRGVYQVAPVRLLLAWKLHRGLLSLQPMPTTGLGAPNAGVGDSTTLAVVVAPRVPHPSILFS